MENPLNEALSKINLNDTLPPLRINRGIKRELARLAAREHLKLGPWIRKRLMELVLSEVAK